MKELKGISYMAILAGIVAIVVGFIATSAQGDAILYFGAVGVPMLLFGIYSLVRPMG
jgi:hypothetical protein